MSRWTFHPKHTVPYNQEDPDGPKVPDTWTFSSYVGHGFLCANAGSLIHTQSINGSGSKAFGGASEWPTLKFGMSFQVGEEAMRDKLSEEIQRTVERFFAAWTQKPITK